MSYDLLKLIYKVIKKIKNFLKLKIKSKIVLLKN